MVDGKVMNLRSKNCYISHSQNCKLDQCLQTTST